MTTQVSDPRWETRREQWLDLIRQVLTEIGGWAEAEGWFVDRGQKEIHEDLLGTYDAPTLRIRAPGGILHVEPIALQIVGADGRVDLEAWPSLNRVKLIRAQDQWRVITDSGVPIREPWNQQSFVQLATDLVSQP